MPVKFGVEQVAYLPCIPGGVPRWRNLRQACVLFSKISVAATDALPRGGPTCHNRVIMFALDCPSVPALLKSKRHRTPSVKCTVLWLALVLPVPLMSGDEQASAQPTRPLQTPVNWRPTFQGVAIAEIEAKSDPPCRGKAVRIDLSDPGIRFVLTPGNGEAPGETGGLRTSTFATQEGCQIAINAAPFTPIRSEEGLPQDIAGLHVVQGEVVSKPQAGYAALLLSSQNEPSISEGPFDTTEMYNAVGGFGVVLRAGAPTEKVGGPRHPRTAAGVSADKRFLYLLVVDGRQPKFSAGATLAEVGQWLQQLDAYDGINLDGGGSTTLVVRDEHGIPQVSNRPIHTGISGTQRVNASHLGVKALPLDRAALQLPHRDGHEMNAATVPVHPGKKSFDAYCAACHQLGGQGTEGRVPPLTGSPWVAGSEDRLIRIALHGLRGPIEINGEIYNLEMPAFGPLFKDEDIASVLSYVRQQYGAPSPPVTRAAVSRVRDATRDREIYWTVKELLELP